MNTWRVTWMDGGILREAVVTCQLTEIATSSPYVGWPDPNVRPNAWTIISIVRVPQ